MFKNVAGQKAYIYAYDASTGLPKSGDAANISLAVSKDGAAPAALGTVAPAEVSSTLQPGWYAATLTQAETNADQMLVAGKSSTANVVVVGAAIFTRPANFTALGITSGGSVAVQVGYKKNAAVSGLPVQMTDSTSHAPVTGKTVSVFVSIDGAAYVAATPATATEIGNGMYAVSLSAANMNGSNIGVRCTAAGCDDQNFVLSTAP